MNKQKRKSMENIICIRDGALPEPNFKFHKIILDDGHRWICEHCLEAITEEGDNNMEEYDE